MVLGLRLLVFIKSTQTLASFFDTEKSCVYYDSQ